MIVKYITELKPYSFKEMCSLMECSEGAATRTIKELKAYKVLKEIRAGDVNKDLTDLIDESLAVEEVDANGNLLYYAFTYVGVIKVTNCIFLCLPKYVTASSNYHDTLKSVIQVLKRYNSKKQIITLFNDIDDKRTFNDLAVYIFLLEDYYENGNYRNDINVLEKNGAGDINWNRTINNSFALIKAGRPYYTEMYTRKRVKNDYDYIKRLHECILTIASRELLLTGIADLFDISPVELSEECLGDFGEKEYILYRIENELNIQFNSRKQLVLKSLYAYVSQIGNSSENASFSMFGTNSYNLVWQEICSQVFSNMLSASTHALELDDEPTTIRDLISKPQWFSYTPGGEQLVAEADTLDPDIVSIFRDENSELYFIIYDAKYYNLVLNPGEKLRGNPGVESISKQYFYELAYTDFIKKHQINKVANCFLFPYEGNDYVNKGYVTFQTFGNLSPIQAVLLPAEIMNQFYLSGATVSPTDLGIYFSKPQYVD